MLTAEPPAPKDPSEAARVQETAMRRRMLEGCWAIDAEEREADFFSAEVRNMLTPPELSRNPAYCLTKQISTAYDSAPTVEVKGETDLSPIVPPTLWPLCQERLRYTNGLQQCLMRVDLNSKGKVVYRFLTPDFVVGCLPAEDDATQPMRVSEWRVREKMRVEGQSSDDTHEWTLETWDVSDPANPIFKIEVKTEQGWMDATDYYYPPEKRVKMPNGKTSVYPYWNKSWQPIFPYVMYHAQVGQTLFTPFLQRELFIGTLSIAVLWTFWMTGVRDGSYPNRYVIDGDVKATATIDNGLTTQQVVRLNPQVLVQIASRKQGDTYLNASVGQWNPTMDPATTGAAIEQFEAGLAIYAGLEPSDITRGSSGSSGYALVVRSEGKRRIQRQNEVPCQLGDQLLLSKAAQLVNATSGSQLPENPEDYTILYAPIPQSAEERKAERDDVKELLAMGLISRVQAYMRIHKVPREVAVTALEEIDKEAEAAKKKLAPMAEEPEQETNPIQKDEDEDAGK